MLLWFLKNNNIFSMRNKRKSKMEEIITLLELSKIADINKSKLHLYMNIGLLGEKRQIGAAYVVDKKEALDRLDFIKEAKKKKMTLREIAKIID